MHIRLRRTRTQTDEPRGQALVEFALILVPALLILMGIIQFGFLFSGAWFTATFASFVLYYALMRKGT